MPVTDLNQCFWCMPKTASSAISTELTEYRKWHSWHKGHAPCSAMYDHGSIHIMRVRHRRNPWDIPFHFGGIRSPWDWYGSLWKHTEGRQHFLKERERFILKYQGFKGFLYGCTHLEEVDVAGGERAMVILEVWPDRKIPEGSCGLWSWCVDHFYREDGLWLTEALIPSDRASEGLAEVTGVSMSLELKNTARGRLDPLDSVLQHRHQNLTDYKSMFDDEMLEWVEEADQKMRGVFQFKPFESSPSAVYWFSEAAANRETCRLTHGL